MQEPLPDGDVDEGDDPDHDEQCSNEERIVCVRRRMYQHRSDAEEILRFCALRNICMERLGDDDEVPALCESQDGSGYDLRENRGDQHPAEVREAAQSENHRRRMNVARNDLETADHRKYDVPKNIDEKNEDRRAFDKVRVYEHEDDDREEREYRNRIEYVEEWQEHALKCTTARRQNPKRHRNNHGEYVRDQEAENCCPRGTCERRERYSTRRRAHLERRKRRRNYYDNGEWRRERHIESLCERMRIRDWRMP